MKQQQSDLNRIIIVAAVLGLVAIASYFMVVQPKLTQVSASKAQLAQLQAQYAAYKQVADQKPMYMALIKQVQSRLVGVELTADPRAYVPSYLKQIEDLANRDGLLVTAVVPQPNPEASSTPTPAPPTTGTSALEKAPVIGAPIAGAKRAFNATSGQVQAENSQMPQGGANGASAGATPVPGTSANPAIPGPTVKAGATTSPRVNALAYLNRSFEKVPINMELSGNYTNLQKFLRDLNKFPKLIGVGNVTLTSEKAAVGETPKLHIVLPIVAYRLSPNGPVPQASAPADPSNGG